MSRTKTRAVFRFKVAPFELRVFRRPAAPSSVKGVA
jgi:hypothetical protein